MNKAIKAREDNDWKSIMDKARFQTLEGKVEALTVQVTELQQAIFQRPTLDALAEAVAKKLEAKEGGR